jgi:hypothetical protein
MVGAAVCEAVPIWNGGTRHSWCRRPSWVQRNIGHGVLIAKSSWASPAEAMVRLHACITDRHDVSDVAHQIFYHGLHLGDGAPGTEPGAEGS